ncbi:DeoR/GlpR family DNA-binding transcription regulator [Halorientalis regularis]|uniref:HTH domain-containing protein n=1 Tax=Halorientalis regularis TaxID=660518 RepID=A0A1G7UDR8_9EURY|nr:HTH domain-containing protein [Halorientalis regularis]SDG45587.1 hypothetical protein SAMN05216218_1512 [Halorientalis regularis]
MSRHRPPSAADGSTETQQPDYESLELPTKPPSEYSWRERRKELLQLVKQAGHPDALNQTELAERYGVSQQQISKDLDRLAEYASDTLGQRRDLVSEAVFHRAMEGLMEQEEYRKAARTVADWNEWLDHRVEIAELRDRLDRVEDLLEEDGHV